MTALHGVGAVIASDGVADTSRYTGLVSALKPGLRHAALRSETDEPTGIANRRRLFDELTRQLAYAAGHRSTGALLTLDLDNFTVANDTYGRATGDAMLRSVARVLQATAGETDLVARLGGDEFAVLQREASLEEARRLATILRARLCERVTGPPIMISVGIVAFNGSQEATADDIMTCADIALFQAKEGGGDDTRVYSNDTTGARTWPRHIRAAIDEDRLVLYGQPIVETASGKIAFHELLVRMVAENGDIIGPGDFLPAAERFGLIRDIDLWLIDAGLRLARELGLPLTLNLSAHSVGDPAVVAAVRAAVDDGLDPSNVVFEITETAAMADLAAAQTFAGQLKSLGGELALDDFGSGFGSFTYLKYLPARYVKIDTDFVRGLADHPDDQHLIKGIVGIARSLHKLTIAEGVEDAETLALVTELGVDYAQGFYLGRPEPFVQAPSGAKAQLASADIRAQAGQISRASTAQARRSPSGEGCDRASTDRAGAETDRQDAPSARIHVGPRVLAALGVGAVVAHLTVAIADPGAVTTGWLINATFVTGAALCLWRSMSSRRERVAWACVGAGLLFQALADRYYKDVLANQAHVSQPSLADFGYLAFYPLAAVAIVRLLRSRVSSVTRPLLLDGAVLALAVMAAVAAFVLPDVLSISGGDLSASLTNVAYPIADLILLGLLVGGTQLLAGKPDRALILIGVALILFVSADSIYLFRSAAGTYSVGGWVDSLWSVAAVAMGIAAWQPALRYDEFQVWRPALRTLVAVAAAAVAVSAILVADSFHRLPAAAMYLTVATFIAALARLVVAINSERGTRERLIVSEARYQDLALHDPLTGLANRSLFEDRVEHLFNRRTPANAVAFIMVDVDHFKAINDSLGHGAGDELLTEVARRLVECVRPEDTVARLGGDEFCIVLTAETSTVAVRCGERVVAALERPYTLAGTVAHATASVGIAVRTSQEESADDLQQHADQALYNAKADGRGRWAVYDSAAQAAH